MSAKMQITLINRGESGELCLSGRLDAATAPEVEELLLNAAERFGTVILNMGELAYISSAGLRVLKRLHMEMTKKQGTLQLKNVNHSVMEVFEMTGFVGLLNII